MSMPSAAPDVNVGKRQVHKQAAKRIASVRCTNRNLKCRETWNSLPDRSGGDIFCH